ncbi:MAG TPA: hypothetical protein VLJ44_04285 [Gaiellaceae bacterium]|nr:hypothetical protein [Gaiellaceae bacterium]
MTRLLLAFAAVTLLLLPGAASAAACSPLNCAPSQFTLSDGTLVAYRHTALGRVSVADLRTGKHLFSVPGGFVGGNVLVHRTGKQLTWFDLRTGAIKAQTTLPWVFGFSGVSQDGSSAVAFRKVNGAQTLVIISPHSWRQVPLPQGNWDFDALRGTNLFLIKYLKSGSYQVDYVDLSTDSPTAKLIKDPHESGTIWGSPFARLASPDGTLLFTLYVSGNGAAMVHVLNLVKAQARCIDLPGTGDYGGAASWAMALAPGAHPSTLWAVSPGYKKVVGINVGARKVATAFAIDVPGWNIGWGTRIALGRDGSEIAVADGKSIARIGLGERRVIDVTPGNAVALGYAPITGLLRVLR